MNLQIVTTLWNPKRDPFLTANYWTFRDALGPHAEKLLTVELLLDGDTPAVLDALHLYGDSERYALWQKEAMLNVAFKRLPADVDAVMWLDADVQFQNPKWYEQTCKSLQRAAVVQPFAQVRYLDQNGHDEPLGIKQSAARGIQTKGLPLGFPGLAIAARREVVAEGIDDSHITGCGDTLLMNSWVGRFDYFRKLNTEWRRVALRRGLAAWQKVRGEVSFVPGELLHYFHGPLKERHYDRRTNTLREFAFDPERDVAYDRQGLLRWTDRGVRMEGEVRRLFGWPVPPVAKPHGSVREIVHEKFGRSPQIPLRSGILTAADSAFFGAAQLLILSLRATHECEIAFVDLGLTERQRTWCVDEGVQLVECPTDLIVPRSEPRWQTWNKPLYLLRSPFERTIWLDSDMLVVGDISPLDAVSRLAVPHCNVGWSESWRRTLVHKPFGTVSPGEPLINAGLIAGASHDLLREWIGVIERMAARGIQAPCQDQDALQWLLDQGSIPYDLLPIEWNDYRPRLRGSTPEECVSRLLPDPATRIVHLCGQFYARQQTWDRWGELPVGLLDTQRAGLLNPARVAC